MLVREPFNLTMDQIASLTDDQVLNVYFRPRDEDGRLVRKPLTESSPGEAVSFKEAFFTNWRERGLSQEQIEERWQEYLKKNPGAEN